MSKIEILVATMHQRDFSKLEEMNIQSDVFFANQTDFIKFEEQSIDDKRVRMLSTLERGVGKNRNLALLFSKAEICLLSDDDIVYENEYKQIIETAFKELPMADIIIFNIDTIGENDHRKKNTKIKRIREHNFLNYGAVRIAFRRESVIKNNIWFSLKFGGGALFGSGEDTLFLREALRKGLIIFTYPVKIATVKQETSTWFTGYNEKFFHDKGALVAAAFPILKYLIAFIFSVKFTVKTKYSFIEIFNWYIKGIKAFRENTGYEEN